MKKRKSKSALKDKTTEISPEAAVRFLEDIRLMQAQLDEPTEAISIRVPGNILRALRLRAKAENRKYQSLMIDLIRRGLLSKSDA